MEIVREYLELDLNYYFPGVNFPITLFLLALTLGMCIACFMITAKKRAMSLVIKQLARHEAFSEETAKTLSDMKIRPSLVIKYSLTHRTQLTHIVSTVGTYPHLIPYKRGEKRERTDFSTARFYLTEEGMTASIKWREGSAPSYINTALGCVLIAMVFITIIIFVPEFLTLISGVR